MSLAVKERVSAALTRARRRVPLLDHAIRTFEWYSDPRVNGNVQAAGVTYFAFLSIFPILAIAFFVVGLVAEIYPGAEADLTDAIDQVLPGMVGDGEGEISLGSIRSSARAAGLVGLAVLLYSGLSWLSAMRTALQAVFSMPKAEQPNVVVGTVRSLLTLAAVGFTLVLSVSISGAVTGFSERLIDLAGLGAEVRPVLAVVSVVVGLAADVAFFYLLFTLLARPDCPRRALRSGALLGAIGFEILKWASSLLLSSTKSQPAFQAFGIALILLVWIYYLSRVILYAAAWAQTAPSARAARAGSGLDTGLVPRPGSTTDGTADPSSVVEPSRGTRSTSSVVEPSRGTRSTSSVVEPSRGTRSTSSVVEPSRGTSEESRPRPLVAYVAGAASTLAAVALLRRRKDAADADR